jgi:hypothetical protein
LKTWDMHAGIHARSPADEKITLFRSLFKGREDVYPRRFESRKTGRSGYAPACGNEWVRGICEKPRIKCADCPHRAFLPVTDGTPTPIPGLSLYPPLTSDPYDVPYPPLLPAKILTSNPGALSPVQFRFSRK